VPQKNSPLQKVALFCHRPQTFKKTCTEIINVLLKHNKTVVLEENTAKNLPQHTQLKAIPHTKLGEHASLLIVIGGDGSMLQAARFAAPQDLPVLGINKGRLGFLTDINPGDTQSIIDVLSGAYVKEKRSLMTTTLINQKTGAQKKIGLALNEVLFSRSTTIELQTFDIFIDKRFVCRQHADGLIISTPTGSTAYSLSSGGPILHPGLKAFCLVPMCPHTLNSRPLIIDDRSQIELIPYHQPYQKHTPIISCDAHNQVPVLFNEHIVIQRFSKPLYLLHPLDYHYYATLTSKLHWERKPLANTTDSD
jgi:NAD+ kinase